MKKQHFSSLLIFLIIFSLSANSAPAADTIVIDDVRSLQLTESTAIKIDGRLQASEQFGSGFLSRTLSGYKARVTYSDNGSENGGYLSEIDLLNSVLGPVTSNDNFGLQVLTESVPLNGDIVFVGFDNINQLELGNIVAVSGLETPAGGLRVTRIEYLADGSDYWLVTGNISGIAESGFFIRNQFIHTNASTEVECGAESLETDLKVVVGVTPIESYTVNQDLHAEKVTCFEDFNPPIVQPPVVLISGGITQINEFQSQMVVDGHTINLNDATQIISKTGSTELELNMNVTVSGSVVQQTGEVTADYVYVADQQGSNPITASGEILSVNEAKTEFTIPNTTVLVSPTTSFVNGSLDDLIVGALVDVTGVEDTNSGSLIAEAVFFRDNDGTQPSIFFSGFVTNIATDGSQITVDSQVVNVSENTQVSGAISNLNDLVLDDYVQVNGNLDATTNIVNAVGIHVTRDSGGGLALGLTLFTAGKVSESTSETFVLTISTLELEVNFTSNTEFFNGTLVDLIDDVFIHAVLESDTPNNPNAPGSKYFATRITFVDEQNYVADIVGVISNLSADGSEFNVGSETITVSDDTFMIRDEPANGREIESLAGVRDPVTNVIAAIVLNLKAVPQPGDYIDSSGIIQSVNQDRSQFTLGGGDIVNILPSSSFENGTQSDLIVGASVHVGGILNDINENDAVRVTFNTNTKKLVSKAASNTNNNVNGTGIITNVIEDVIFRSSF